MVRLSCCNSGVFNHIKTNSSPCNHVNCVLRKNLTLSIRNERVVSAFSVWLGSVASAFNKMGTGKKVAPPKTKNNIMFAEQINKRKSFASKKVNRRLNLRDPLILGWQEMVGTLRECLLQG